MEFQILTKEDLKAFKEEMLEAITEVFIKNKSSADEEYLRTKELRAMLGISEGSLYNLRTYKGLPFIRLGDGIYLYEKKKIIAYLERHRIDLGSDELIKD